jgi:hypothetical protein
VSYEHKVILGTRTKSSCYHVQGTGTRNPQIFGSDAGRRDQRDANAVACPSYTTRACRYTSNVVMAQRGLLYETAEAITGQLERDEWLRDTSDRGPLQGPSERTAQSQPSLQSVWKEAAHLGGMLLFFGLWPPSAMYDYMVSLAVGNIYHYGEQCQQSGLRPIHHMAAGFEDWKFWASLSGVPLRYMIQLGRNRNSV